GAFTRRYSAPAHLTLTVTPPGAQVTLFRVGEDVLGRRVAAAVSEPGPPPPGPAEMAPGGYLLEFAAPGRALVRYPLVLGRDESLRLQVELPAQAAVPAGFVYVPAGRSLFGSTAEELRRSFYDTVPLHEVRTTAYLIARN